MNCRDMFRRCSVLLALFLASSVLPSFAVATPIVMQDGGGSAPAAQSADSGANGVYKIGGDVSAPVVIHQATPKFSEKARNAQVAGNVLVRLYVDPNGNPSHVHVIRGIGPNGVGLDLDESAVEAVKKYKFKPAMKNGKPVRVELNIEVNFQTQ